MYRGAGAAKVPEECASIGDVRRGIDAIDREIIGLIGERSRYVDAAAKFKVDEVAVRAPERQKAMLEQRRRWAEEERLDPATIERLYRDLIHYFVNREKKAWEDDHAPR